MSNHIQTSNGHLSNIKSGIDSLLSDSNGAATHALLEGSIGHINNMDDLGSGSNQLRACALAVMPSGNGRILSCDVDGKLNVNADVVVADQDLVARTDIADVATRKNLLCSSAGRLEVGLDLYAGGGNNDIGEGSTKLQIFNYGRDVAGGKYRPMVVNSSAEQIVALSSVDNAVLDAIATDGDAIQTKLDTIDGSINTIEGCVSGSELQVDIVGGGFDGVVSGTVTANLSATDNAVLDAIAADGDAIQTKLDTIDGSINTIEGCVSGSELQVDIVGGGFDGVVSGTVTANLSATDNAVLDAIDTNTDNIDTKLDHLSGDLDTLHTDLATGIGGKLDHLSDNSDTLNSSIAGVTAAVDALKVQNNGDLNDAIGKLDHLSGDLDTIDGVLDASLVKQTAIETLITSTNSKIDTLDAVQDSALTKLTEIDTAIDTIDSVLDASLVKQTALETLITSTNSKIDTLDAVQDSALTKLTEIDTAVDTIDSVLDASLVKQTAIETLITSTNTKIDTLDAVQDSALTKLTEIDTAIDTIDSVLDASLVKQTAVETLITQLDVVADASLVKHTANETLLTAVSQKLGDIETAVQLLDNCVSGNEMQVDIVSGGGGATARTSIATGTSELAHNELVGSVDCSAFSDICVMYPTSQSSNKLRLFVKGATTSGGTYHTFAQMTRKEYVSDTDGGGTTTHVWGTGEDQHNASFIPCVYPHIKIQNVSGTNFADSDAIRIVGK